MMTRNCSRRSLLKAVGTGVVAVSSRSSAAAPERRVAGFGTEVGQWSQLHGGAANTRFASGESTPVRPRTAWRFDGDDGAFTAPATDGELLYAGGRDAIHALDPTDGTVQWSVTDADGERFSAPTVHESTVFVGRHEDAVYALDGTTGRVDWRSALGEEVEGVRPPRSFSAATVHEGIVYIVGQGRPYTTRRRHKLGTDVLYALDAGTGETLWHRDAGRAGGVQTVNAPPVAAGGDTVYLAEDDLVALDARTGEERWATDIDGSFKNADGEASAPAVEDGTVFAGGRSDGTVVAVDASDGSLRWRYDGADDVSTWTSPAVTGDAVVVGEGTRGSFSRGAQVAVRSLRANDGVERWRRMVELPSPTDRVSSPVVAGDAVFFGSAALELADGTVRWSLDTTMTAPAVVDGTLYTGGPELLALGDR